MAMGAADVVPGVSGGTIAFISGIYEELIQTINGLNLTVLQTLQKKGMRAAWKQLNGNFLFALLFGIGISILTFAKAITYFLHEKPLLIWGFFFGLVLASILLMIKEVRHWKVSTVLSLLVGAVAAYYITVAQPATAVDSYYYLFISGFIAIIAMILPGISGAFILLLMGSYQTVIGLINGFRESISNGDWQALYPILLKIATFGIGAVLGLKLFSKILNWMFAKHKDVTLAILIGFMIGSLNKIWPWKKTLLTSTDSHGNTIPILERNVSPIHFEGDPQFIPVGILCLAGLGLILLLEKFAKHKAQTIS